MAGLLAANDGFGLTTLGAGRAFGVVGINGLLMISGGPSSNSAFYKQTGFNMMMNNFS